MEVEYTAQPEDIVALNEFYFRNLPRLRRAGYVFLVILFLVAINLALAVKHYVQDPAEGSLTWVVVLGLLFAFLLAFWLWPRFWLRLAVLRMLRQGSNARNLLGWHLLEIWPQEVRVQTENGRTACQWKLVADVAVTDEHVFFFTLTRTAIIVPRRAFASEAEFQAFLQAAQTYWEAAHEP